MKKFVIMMLVHLRWAYFHIHPGYQKFYMTETEAHFQHRKTGALFCNYTWNDED